MVVTKIHFINYIHLRIFRNVQKEKKDVTVFSSAFFPVFSDIMGQLSFKNRIDCHIR